MFQDFNLFHFVSFCSIAALLGLVAGCGTTKWSDTGRTGTEQLLISQAIDHAVGKIDFSILRYKKVYLNTEAIDATTDHLYLKTTIRQYVAASGALLSDKAEECDFILEVRSGAVGTDRSDVLIGVPSMSVPYMNAGTFSTAQMPEIPFFKKTDQRAVVKIAVFAYDRESGHPLWASGNKLAETRAKAWWAFGAGPVNKGTIYPETLFAGEKINWTPSWRKTKPVPVDHASLPLFFEEGPQKGVATTAPAQLPDGSEQNPSPATTSAASPVPATPPGSPVLPTVSTPSIPASPFAQSSSPAPSNLPAVPNTTTAPSVYGPPAYSAPPQAIAPPAGTGVR